MMELLKQGMNAPVPVAKQICAMYAGSKGHLDTVPVDKILKTENELYALLDADKTILESIVKEKVIVEATEKKLIKLIEKAVELNK